MDKILDLWLEIPAPIVIWTLILLPYVIILIYPKVLCKLNIHHWNDTRWYGDFGESYPWFSKCIICNKTVYQTED